MLERATREIRGRTRSGNTSLYHIAVASCLSLCLGFDPNGHLVVVYAKVMRHLMQQRRAHLMLDARGHEERVPLDGSAIQRDLLWHRPLDRALMRQR